MNVILDINAFCMSQEHKKRADEGSLLTQKAQKIITTPKIGGVSKCSSGLSRIPSKLQFATCLYN